MTPFPGRHARTLITFARNNPRFDDLWNRAGRPGMHREEDVMERRHFLKLAFGFAAGAAAFAASARAAPLVPHPLAEDGRCRHRTRMPVPLSPPATRWNI